jgi:GrpB-like predicted nucleotidyltransferase (UPF0157 family)
LTNDRDLAPRYARPGRLPMGTTAAPIRLMHYDPRWRQEFEQIRSSILDACHGVVVAVEHIGSTAISGLVAQPIIDCVAGTRSAPDLAQAETLIEGLFCRPRTDLAILEPGDVRLDKPRYGSSTHHIYLTVVDSPLWCRLVKVRDRLRLDRDLALRFEEAKVHRWECRSGEPLGYAEGKSLLFDRLERSAGPADFR